MLETIFFILFKYKIILEYGIYILVTKISWWINKYKLHKNWFIRTILNVNL